MTQLWTPPADVREVSRMGRLLGWLATERGLVLDGYDELWRWSVDDLEAFWDAVADVFDVRWHRPPSAVLGRRSMPGAEWFPGGELSYPEHALAAAGGDGEGRTVVVARSQTRPPVDLTAGQLHEAVARCRTGLQRLGVGRGDRVVAYLPNIPEALVAFLATASLGAVWSSCAPEFGTRAVIDRWSQIEPVVLLTVDGYRYGSKAVDRVEEVGQIRAALPSLRGTVVVPYLQADPSRVPGAVPWDDLGVGGGPLDFEPVPFDHPLYILYSSGTTGLPKPIVHGHGGILLEHLKVLGLHHDLGGGDRFFWFSTTGWMMWNLLVSGLAVGSAVVLFDGDPGWPDLGALWRLAAETGTTVFGASAPFFLACRKDGVEPRDVADVSLLRAVASTGAPLPPEGFVWIGEHVSGDVPILSVSGGTDMCTAFVAGAPLVPVWLGEISCRCLGAKVEAFDAAGRSVVGEQGELVITEPMPSMPVGLWGDEDGTRYRATYHADHGGVWNHGDWITITPRGSCVISGRSDATLNRGGVRLGTSEFYSVVESLPEVADSLVVHLEDDGGGPGRLLLFVVLRPGTSLEEVRPRIVTALRSQLSPRHVPDEIHPVRAIPRTLSGKKLEVPLKRILSGTPVAVAVSPGALADPSALDDFTALAPGPGPA